MSEHMTNMQQLFTSSTVEPGVRNETGGAALVCRCGKTFSKDERGEFEVHKMQRGNEDVSS